MADKPRVVKDYEKLDVEIQEQIKLRYPYGFDKHLVRFTNKDGALVSALPFESDEKYYLVRMTAHEARAIVREDDDYDASGELKSGILEEYKDRYADDDEADLGDDSLDNIEEAIDPDAISDEHMMDD